jgi:glycosyltransferase involved in cell wall biosynthesis
MVIVEAMAMGRPVVTTPVGIAPEVVEDGVSGVLARDGSVSGLGEALERALASRDRWAAFGAEAARRAQEFRAERMVAEYERLYERSRRQ